MIVPTLVIPVGSVDRTSPKPRCSQKKSEAHLARVTSRALASAANGRWTLKDLDHVKSRAWLPMNVRFQNPNLADLHPQRKTGIHPFCRILTCTSPQQLANGARPTDRRTFDFCSISPKANPVEVFRLAYRKITYLQCVARNSPNQRSHQVQRLWGRENRFSPIC